MKKAYFISDLHLGASYIANPREHEARVVRFLDSIASDAAELYLLGDVLDYWFEYRFVAPQGHIRFFAALARLADAGVRILWLTGNHDVWLFNYLRHEIGFKLVRKGAEIEVMGHRFFISHGDDVGRRPLGYRIMRWFFYNRVCQVLYAAIHPRWTVGFATGWSASNRTRRNLDLEARNIERSYQHLKQFSVNYNTTRNGAVEHFVYGHLHVARQEQLAEGTDITILGDWINHNTYAVFDGTNLSLRSFV